MAQRRAVIVGAGVSGLCTAIELSKRGWRVCVVSRDGPLSALTTSSGAGGLWMPFHIEPEEASSRWASRTLDVLLSERKSGGARGRAIEVLPVLNLKARPSRPQELPRWASIPEICFEDLSREAILQKDFTASVPEGVWGAWCFTAPVVHMEPYIESLVAELDRRGALLSFGRAFASLGEAYDFGSALLGAPAHALVNCTGLGANAICEESQGVVAGRGVVLKARRPFGCDAVITSEIAPFSEVSPAYAIPRGRHQVTLGGTYIEGDERLEPTPREVEDLKRKAKYLYPQFEEELEVQQVWVGLRPVRSAVRLDVEALPGRSASVLHNFGHGGGGVTVMWGAAEEGVEMLERALQRQRARL